MRDISLSLTAVLIRFWSDLGIFPLSLAFTHFDRAAVCASELLTNRQEVVYLVRYFEDGRALFSHTVTRIYTGLHRPCPHLHLPILVSLVYVTP